ncbi:ABC-F family ATP-binding cassette domain-containing protein [Bacillaceae bacterium Marseille-Q3522]|nr:ABC-F family ATP-binding cassette domain-containing protein [Bacillaceae bacterium Marseille-Q3522]
MDEPTNHLDIDSKDVMEEALSHFKGTIIAVSHDRYFLDHFFPVTYWLSACQLVRFEGNYTFAREKSEK